MVLLAYSGRILCHPIRFSVQYLQFLKCMEHNETYTASDWVEHVILVCADPLSQVSKYAGKVYSVSNISTECDRVSFQTPSEAASRANAQQTTTKVFRRCSSHFTWHTEPWRHDVRLVHMLTRKEAMSFQGFMSHFWRSFQSSTCNFKSLWRCLEINLCMHDRLNY